MFRTRFHRLSGTATVVVTVAVSLPLVCVSVSMWLLDSIAKCSIGEREQVSQGSFAQVLFLMYIDSRGA